MSCLPLLFKLCLPLSSPALPPAINPPSKHQIMTSPTPLSSGLASRYGDKGDRYENFSQPYACHGKLSKSLVKIKYKEFIKQGIAHRTLPCGTKLTICKGNVCTFGFVVDRGPYGALDAQGHWHRRNKLLPGERWRGIVDLLPPVANALQIRGIEKVKIYLTKSSF